MKVRAHTPQHARLAAASFAAFAEMVAFAGEEHREHTEMVLVGLLDGEELEVPRREAGAHLAAVARETALWAIDGARLESYAHARHFPGECGPACGGLATR